MPDFEKVFKGLDRCYKGCPVPVDCPYKDNHKCCEQELLGDALELLKKQIPEEPIRKKGQRFMYYVCPKCGTSFPTGEKPKFCHECGKAIIWKEDTKTQG